MAEIKTRAALNKAAKTIDNSALIARRMRVEFTKQNSKSSDAPENAATEDAGTVIHDMGHSAYFFVNQLERRSEQLETENKIKKETAKLNCGRKSLKKQQEERRNNAAPAFKTREITVNRAPRRSSDIKLRTNPVFNREDIKKSGISGNASAEQMKPKRFQTAAAGSRTAADRASVIAKDMTNKAGKKVSEAFSGMLKSLVSSDTKKLTALMGGGGAALVLIALICSIGIMFGSVFGIFFSNENTGSGMTMSSAIREINAEYNSRLTGIVSSVNADEVETSGGKAPWKDILAVFAVKTNTDTTDGMDVMEMDQRKLRKLKAVFWDMHEISYSLSARTEPAEEAEAESADTEPSEPVEVTITTLTIHTNRKTADEMADIYGFNPEQRKRLYELRSDDYKELWAELLYGLNTSVAPANLAEVEKEIAETLLSYGFTPQATAAVLGNLKAESGMNPASDVVMDGMFNYEYERACGLFQYTSTSPGSGEYWNFKNWCSANGYEWYTVEAQLLWTFGGEAGGGNWYNQWMSGLALSGYYSNCPGYELVPSYDCSPDEFMMETDLMAATFSWMACYERPANGEYAHLDRRLQYAMEYYAGMG